MKLKILNENYPNIYIYIFIWCSIELHETCQIKIVGLLWCIFFFHINNLNQLVTWCFNKEQDNNISSEEKWEENFINPKEQDSNLKIMMYFLPVTKNKVDPYNIFINYLDIVLMIILAIDNFDNSVSEITSFWEVISNRIFR